jgi:hypothetical protein
MNFPRMRSLGALLCAASAAVLFCLPAGALNDGREHAIPPNQQHGGAQAGLGIHFTVAPVVLPPRHRDHDKDKDKDQGEAAVIYNLAPATEKLSITRETRAMLVEGGRQQVNLTTLVLE